VRGHFGEETANETRLHSYAFLPYIYTSGDTNAGNRVFDFVQGRRGGTGRILKFQRHNAIRELVAHSALSNQDELRRKLRRRGFEVTQATLSRDIHELRLSKGPGGYSLPAGNSAASAIVDDGPPSVVEMIESFGLRVRQAMNQVVVSTAMGGAQPVAASLDREGWPEVVGTIAGDDTVLVICLDARRANEVEARLRAILES
jgi:transcriptional regulator of arginine metabolism